MLTEPAFAVKAVSELESATVTAAQAEFTAILQAAYPTLDLRRGVIHDIIAFLAGGVIGGICQTEINRVLQSRSLLSLQQNPTLANNDMVDHVLSNVGISRRVGIRARGELTILVQGSETFVIAGNSPFTTNGVTVRATTAIVAKPPGTTIASTTERVMTARDGDSFSFTIPVVADDVGVEYNLRINTAVLPDPVPARFVTAYASSDFTGGTSTESNAELITRYQHAIPAGMSGGRANLLSLIKSQDAFGDTLQYSFIGFGDPEMSRDQRTIFPGSAGGGYLDVYAKTAEYPLTTTATITCTVIEKLASSVILACSIGRDVSPGFYNLLGIKPVTDVSESFGYIPISVVKGLDLSGDGWRPDILTIPEGAFSRWQTAAVSFEDTATAMLSAVVGDTKDYLVSFIGSPLIADLQGFLGSETVRPWGTDVLVRAAVPCLLQLNIVLLRDADESAPELSSIKRAIVSYVNSLDFSGVLYSSKLIDIIHSAMGGNTVVGTLVMQGKITPPTGDAIVIRHSAVLRIPNMPANKITAETTVFFLDVGNVSISVQVKS